MDILRVASSYLEPHRGKANVQAFCGFMTEDCSDHIIRARKTRKNQNETTRKCNNEQ